MRASALQEIQLQNPLTIGASGPAVKRVQEWLTLGRIGVLIDGSFGPATADAVKMLQQKMTLPSTGVVDSSTMGALVSAMTTALAPITPSDSLGADVCRAAEQHIAQNPREIGGENCGPWVRLYMNGDQGVDFPWCAGFACSMIAQAAGDRPLPFPPSFSCDELGQTATAKGFLRPGAGIDPSSIPPGSLFLVKKLDGSGWHHTGIVVAAGPTSLTTIEGNTNADGSREGYEAIRRVRSYNNIDFLIYEN